MGEEDNYFKLCIFNLLKSKCPTRAVSDVNKQDKKNNLSSLIVDKSSALIEVFED